MTILGKISGLVWDKENKRNRELVDSLFEQQEKETREEFRQAQLNYAGTMKEIRSKKDSLYGQETDAQKAIAGWREARDVADTYGYRSMLAQQQQLYLAQQNAQANLYSQYQGITPGSSGASTNITFPAGATISSSGSSYTGSSIGTGIGITGNSSLYPPSPDYSTLGLGSSDKNVFFTLLRGIEERAQFDKAETHPYYDDALAIQDMRKFNGTISFIGILSFCLANALENIDGVIHILTAYGMKIE